jgi:hypothetical protein
MTQTFHPSPSTDAPRHGELPSTAQRRALLHALHVLEYALDAPAPRRQRTWLHRVQSAVDALGRALDRELRDGNVRDEQRDLAIALAAVRERIEPDAEFGLDPDDIRARLAVITDRLRQLCP